VTTSGETRLLAEGDRIAAYPCTVTIERVGIAGATGRCDYCADEHVIDRHRYESGRGPWQRVDSRGHQEGSNA
jgi:hypothetical protein